MADHWKELDPDLEQEQQKYDRPVPSRALIMQHLEERGAPANHNQLCRELAVASVDEVEALRRRLHAMVRDGQLLKNRKGAFGLLSKMDLVAGRVQGHRDGYGFLIPDDGSEDLFLSNRQMRQVFDGDRVAVRIGAIDRRGRREGVIVEVLERGTEQLVGRYFEESGSAFLVPDNKRITREILIRPGALMPSQGQYVLVDLVEQPDRTRLPVGVVREILGDHMAPGMEIEVAIRSHEIPHQWPEAVLEQIKAFGPEVREQDKELRVDLRHLPLVTIDGEDARDFDDAVYCETKKSGGWRLFVAIADVSHYVAIDSALDIEGRERGNSVYFPGHVVPMLPEVLSNGLCSLNPEVDRLAMVCEMTISQQGRISGYKFYEGLIRSHARLTYTEVSSILQHGRTAEGRAARKARQNLLVPLTELYNLYKVLLKARFERGAIDFETTETRILFGAERKIERIVPTVRNDAHRLIEECMLCANVCAAKLLEKHRIPTLYRVHQGPAAKKLENLKAFLGELGLTLPGGDKPTPSDYQALLERVKKRPDFRVIQTMLLRSMSQAVYTPENEGHFGLGFQAYGHFTSPIRRYPDLLVHRAIRQLIRAPKGTFSQALRAVRRISGAASLKPSEIYPYDLPKMLELGEHCSLTERRADEATRDVTDWLKCEYMQQHLGQTLPGLVTAVTGFGLFVELQDVFVEGLVHISALPGDYYHFDAARQRLQGERTGTIFGLGDSVEVTVVRVDLEERKIDFELASGFKPSGRRGRGRKGATRGRSLRTESSPEQQIAERKQADLLADKFGDERGESSEDWTYLPAVEAPGPKIKGAARKSRKKKSSAKKKQAPAQSAEPRADADKPQKAKKHADKAAAEAPVAKRRKRRRSKKKANAKAREQ